LTPEIIGDRKDRLSAQIHVEYGRFEAILLNLAVATSKSENGPTISVPLYLNAAAARRATYPSRVVAPLKFLKLASGKTNA